MRKSFLSKIALEEGDETGSGEKASSSALVDTPPVVDDIKPVEGGVLAEGVEIDAALAETDETDASIDELTEQITEGTEVVEAMESMAVVLRESLKTGGMTEREAKLFNITTNHMHNVVGIKKSKLPALESYGSNTGRTGSTKLALETVTDTVKKIWEAIKKAVAKVVAFINELFFSFTAQAAKLKSRLGALRKTFEDGNNEKDIDIDYNDHKGLFDKILIDGENLDESIKTFGVASDSFYDGYVKQLLEVAINLKNAFSKDDIEETNSLGEFFSKPLGSDFVVDTKKSNENVAYATLPKPLPGNKIVVNKFNKKSFKETKGGVINDFKLYIDDNDVNVRPRDGERFSVSFSQAARIAETVAKLSDSISDTIGKNSKLSRAIENLRSDLKSDYEESIKKNDSGFEVKLRLYFVRLVYSQITDVLQKPVINYTRYALSTGNAFVSLIELVAKKIPK